MTMKILRTIAVSAMIACMTATGVFATGNSRLSKQTMPQKSIITLNAIKDSNETQNNKDKDELKCPDCPNKKKDTLSSLVKSGTITQAQADAIKTALKSARKSDKSIKDALDSLVKAGTITQAQKDAVLKAMPSKDGIHGHREHFKSKINELVKAGTITQAQADAIKTALKSARKSDKTFKEALDDLVKAGTITQAQEDSILKIFPAGKKESPENKQ
jgi:competence protein ComGC